MNILVCDDAGFIRAITKEALQDFANLQIFEAKDGQQAIDMIEAMEFEVVILDLVLPQKNGLQVAQHIRQQFGDMFIIAITSLDLAQDPQLQLAKNLFNHWLKKPFTKAQLIDAVSFKLSLSTKDYQQAN